MITITTRTHYSFIQFLQLQKINNLTILLKKHNFNAIENLEPNIDKSALIQEVIETKNALRNSKETRQVLSPAATFDERWSDLIKCLYLDGYKLENNKLIKIEPNIDGIIALEDDLINEITISDLLTKDSIIDKINESATYFKQVNPDYNACLSSTRIVLETIIRDGSDKSWGESLSKLVSDNKITEKEEKAIASTYTFISDGSHIPLGFTDEEYARYGRNLIMSVCYYLIKRRPIRYIEF